jgi:hypothetical protein
MPTSIQRVAVVFALSSLGAACQPHGTSKSTAPPPAPAPAPAAAAAPAPAPMPAPAPTLAAAATPPPAVNGPVAEVPAGSRLLLRVDDTIDSGRMSAGQRFHASLDAALLDPSGRVVVPARTRVFGVITGSQSAGNVAGRSEVEIAFTDLEIGGVLYPIQSQGVQAAGQSSGGNTARKVAAGALIGGAIGGGKGAAQGAAVGGAAAILTRGKEVKIPAGTILELTLAAPVKVPAPEGSPGSAASGEATSAPAAATPARPSPAAAATAGSASEGANKECIQKLMGSGFTADEAVSSCKKQKK